MDYPSISIIMPVKNLNPYLEECIAHCQSLDYPDYEIIVLPDRPLSQNWEDVKVVPTGPVGPSEKRDKGMEKAKGEVLAFLDDDAFPSPDWLKNAARHFQNKNVAAVGGPAVTPQSDTLRLRKSILEELRGFGNLFWPGEDTFLCLNITQKRGQKIVYDPGVLVYHHRRPLFLPHLKQIKNYTLHRGYFVKHFPETSLQPSYFFRSLWLLGLTGGTVISLFSSLIRLIFLIVVLLYLILTFFSTLESKSMRIVLLVFPGIILTTSLMGHSLSRVYWCGS